jgi:translation elongation factor EF-1beta
MMSEQTSSEAYVDEDFQEARSYGMHYYRCREYLAMDDYAFNACLAVFCSGITCPTFTFAENLHFGGGSDEKSLVKLEIITADPSLEEKELQHMISSIKKIVLQGVRWGDIAILDHVFGLKKILLAWYVLTRQHVF